MISRLIDDFQREGSSLSNRSKQILNAAIRLLQQKALKEAELQKAELYKACDIIIVGAIIFILASEDFDYTPQELFGYQYLYPITLDNPILKPRDQEQDTEVIGRYGHMALVDKTLPFTGIIRKDVFPVLSSTILPSDFEDYNLNTNPQTMDTTERSRPYQEARGKRREQEAQEKMKIKWRRPFGWFGSQICVGIHTQNTISATSNFILRRTLVSNAFDTQESNYSSAEKWGWRALVGLLALFPLTLCLTLPLIIKKEKKEAAEKNALPVQKRTFTLEEYEEIRNKRAQLKRLLINKPEASETKTVKFKKVCIGYDAKGKETSNKDKIKKIEMYCDRGKAKRWNPTFLNSLISKAESKSDEELKAARSEYDNSKAESIKLSREAPFNSLIR